MVLNKIGAPLAWTELAERQPGAGEIRVKVAACERLSHGPACGGWRVARPADADHSGARDCGPNRRAPGAGVEGLKIGERVGVPWLGHTCGVCPNCVAHQEKLSDHPIFTGFTRDGGFATTTIDDALFAFPLVEECCDVALAPLLFAPV